jgi:hypothetical protein
MAFQQLTVTVAEGMILSYLEHPQTATWKLQRQMGLQLVE